jgi:Domain of Unknown Function (DUF928)
MFASGHLESSMKIVSQSTRCQWICYSLAAVAWTISITPAHSFDPPPSEGTPVRTIGGSTRSGRGACRTSPSTAVPDDPALGPPPGPITAPMADSFTSTPLSQSAQTQSAQTQPAQTQPAQTQPAQTQPAQTQPAQTQPSVLVYLPATQATQLELSLFDRTGNGLYQTLIDAPTGSTAIDLPITTQSPGNYWTLALVCNSRDRTQDWVISGIIPPASSSSAQPTLLRLLLTIPSPELAKMLPSKAKAATK